jgi:bis(5'-nucleosyl)-tetraphosphatase (symmetrical)
MVHAGLLPQWSRSRALELAHEVERALVAPDYRDFFAHMYGSQPERWRDELAGWDRLRVIVNAMTRMRFCTPDGKMEFRAKGREAPEGYRPWYETRPREGGLLVCGHWSALGLELTPQVALLDSGCVWGGALTALRLEDRRVTQVACRGYQAAGGD